VWVVLVIFGFLFLIGITASFIQQRLNSAQSDQQNETLQQIAKAVGAAQADTAEVAADTKRQIMQIQVNLADETKPVIVIRFSVDGDKNPSALPSVENIGKSAATNIKIEDVTVKGAHGPGTFEEVDALMPGQSKEVQFDAPDEGLVFRDNLISYLQNDLRSRPPIDWDAVSAGEKDLFDPLKMPFNAIYTDPATGRKYRSEHELEFTFGKRANVIFRKQVEIT
jgi:hypothetical protein